MIKKSKDDLNEMEYLVTQENGTEPPFENEYWNHFEKGFMLIKFLGNHFLHQKKNLNRVVVGRAFQKL